MAKSAAQYMHARLNSVEVGGKKNQPLVENNTTIVQVDLHKLSYEELAQRYTERITEQKPAAEIEVPPISPERHQPTLVYFRFYFCLFSCLSGGVLRSDLASAML